MNRAIVGAIQPDPFVAGMFEHARREGERVGP